MDIMMIGTAVLLAGTVAAIVTSRRRRGFVPTLGAATDGYQLTSVGSLSRVELARFVRHPLAIAGVLLVAVLGRSLDLGDESRAVLNGLGLWPVLLLGFVVVHLAVTRDRRAGTGELSASLPVGTSTSTVAHLVSAAVVALSLGAGWVTFVLALLGADRTTTVRTWGFSGIEWTASIPELAQPLLVAPMVLILAVAVGRWWHHPAAAFLVPFVLFMSPLMWIAPPVVEGGMVESAGQLIQAPAGAVGWHLLYLAGLTVSFVAVALLRHDRRPTLGAAVAVGVAGAVAGFVLGPLPQS